MNATWLQEAHCLPRTEVERLLAANGGLDVCRTHKAQKCATSVGCGRCIRDCVCYGIQVRQKYNRSHENSDNVPIVNPPPENPPVVPVAEHLACGHATFYRKSKGYCDTCKRCKPCCEGAGAQCSVGILPDRLEGAGANPMRDAKRATTIPGFFSEFDEDSGHAYLRDFLKRLEIPFDEHHYCVPGRFAPRFSDADDVRTQDALVHLAEQCIHKCMKAIFPNDPQGLWNSVCERVNAHAVDNDSDLTRVVETAGSMLHSLAYQHYDSPACKAIQAVFAFCSKKTRLEVGAGFCDVATKEFDKDLAKYRADMVEYGVTVEQHTADESEVLSDVPKCPRTMLLFDSVSWLRRSRRFCRRVLGGGNLEKRYVGRARCKPEQVAQMVRFAHENVARLSWDSMLVRVDGASHVVAAKQRLDTITAMYDKYGNDSGIPKNAQVSRSTFFAVITEITDRTQQVWFIVVLSICNAEYRMLLLLVRRGVP